MKYLDYISNKFHETFDRPFQSVSRDEFICQRVENVEVHIMFILNNYKYNTYE